MGTKSLLEEDRDQEPRLALLASLPKPARLAPRVTTNFRIIQMDQS